MRSLLILVFTLFLTQTLFANNGQRCLREASDRQLLNEVSRRMSGGGSEPDESYKYSVSCVSQYLNINSTNMENGQSKRVLHLYMPTPENCTLMNDSLRRALSNRHESLILSICSNSYFYKHIYSQNGVFKQVSKDYIPNCIQMAIDHNNAQ